MSKRRKYTYQNVKNIVEEEGYQLLSKEEEIIDTKGFVYTKTKIKVKCPNENHEPYDVEFNKFKGYGNQLPNRCKQCFNSKQKSSYKEVKEYIENFGYKLLSEEYKNSQAKLSLKCPQGHEFDMIFNNFKRGQRCPYCYKEHKGDYKRKSYEEVKEYFKLFNYELLSEEYINNSTPLKIKCPQGHITNTMTYGNFKQGRRCPECKKDKLSKLKILPYEFVKEYIESFNYQLLDKEYKGNDDYLTLKCPSGHIWNTARFSTFKDRGARCPYCGCNTYEEVKEIVENARYKLLSTFEEIAESLNRTVSYTSYIIVKCPNNNHIPYKVRWGVFKKQNSRCPYCYGESRGDSQRLSYEEVKEYIESFGYELLNTEYVDAKNTLKIKCPKNHKYETTWNKFQQGKRCPHCNESKGERKIIRVLEKYNVEFIQQYKFNNCKFKQCLPFDFYLPRYDILIEYDGEQHYKIKDYFGGFDGFVDRIIRDTIKNEYCKKNNIKLIRIPYWEFNRIEEILIKELKLK